MVVRGSGALSPSRLTAAASIIIAASLGVGLRTASAIGAYLSGASSREGVFFGSCASR
ncbi:hypothetical protein RA11412_2164 [Rothia aeria]|uniref:Uncharacterized protein n=1 Tax=Rothia aeria TaxID=172042 RepID=A0A2Z5R1D2_9MICC|nr:hypothetical protein RA11412_2164 [Rothia aeria]